MNTYFTHVEKGSQLFSYLLAAFAICTLLLILSFGQFFEQRSSMPSSSQVVHAESASMPVAISAPAPPTDQMQVSITQLPSASANSVPQVVPISAPSVP